VLPALWNMHRMSRALSTTGHMKAILETEILPEFIVVDGGEGGTEAAPLELSD
jgi:glutamate synthase domain-containing protein 2